MEHLLQELCIQVATLRLLHFAQQGDLTLGEPLAVTHQIPDSPHRCEYDLRRKIAKFRFDCHIAHSIGWAAADFPGQVACVGIGQGLVAARWNYSIATVMAIQKSGGRICSYLHCSVGRRNTSGKQTR